MLRKTESIEHKTDDAVMFDVIIVGAGPSGLMAGIKLKEFDAQLKVIILEKAKVIGAHSLSGALLEKTK